MRVLFVCLLSALALASATTYFKETFDDSWKERWVESDWKKAAGTSGKFVHSAGKWYGDEEADKGIQTSQDARFYALSTNFPEFSNEGKDLVIQFSVKHEQKIDCGGGYVKVFAGGVDNNKFSGDTDYNIMFGPDICGTGTKKVHAIFNYKGENLLIKKDVTCETDQLTHVYTLIVHPDNTYEIKIDGKSKQKGSLLDDWDFLEPKTIKDPNESKPDDWVDEATIEDPEDTKPEGWDDIPELIADPEAEKPDDWDDEADGEWEPPMLENPEYKGEWKPKRIPNPDYVGKWVHPEIPNPDYVEDDSLYSYPSFGGIGIDVWQVKAGTIFDNIIITDDEDEAAEFMKETYEENIDGEKDMFEEAEKARREEEEAERQRLADARAAEEEEDLEDEDDEDYDDDDHDEL